MGIFNHEIPNLITSFDSFLLAKEVDGLSRSTLDWYELEIRKFIEAQNTDDLTKITSIVIREYLKKVSSHRNPGGIHCIYRAIKVWINWTWKEFELDDLIRNPIAKIKIRHPALEPIPGINFKDFRKLLEAKSTNPIRDRALLLCLLDTAARAAEFVEINWGDVDLISGRVFIRKGKGNKSRVTFIGSRSRRALKAWRHQQNPPTDTYPVWTTQQENRLTTAGLREIIRRKAVSVGLKEVPSPHDFRRASLKSIIVNSADVITASRLAGHSDVRVTQRYDAQNETDLARIFAKASPVDNARL